MKANIYHHSMPSAAPLANNVMRRLEVVVASDNLSLGVDTNESYVLSFGSRGASGSNGASLHAETVYGALHGLETFSQLTTRRLGHGCPIGINSSVIAIADEPRFRWRGLMLDSARHFLPLEALLSMLDAMSYNKLNVLHWHVSDSQAFPLVTKLTPRLSLGAPSSQSLSSPRRTRRRRWIR